jgi:hypothetical protein
MSHRFLLLLTGLNALLVLAAWKRSRDADGPTVLQAQRIDLLDAKGKVKGQLYVGEDGSGQLRLRTASGEVAVKLGALQEGGGSLLLLNPAVEPGVVLAAGPTGAEISVRQDGRMKRVAP